MIGRLRQLGTDADGLEEADVAGSSRSFRRLLTARRGNEATFTVRQWDPAGVMLVDTVASAQISMSPGPPFGNS